MKETAKPSIDTRHENLAKKYENPIEKRQNDKIAYTLHPPEGEFTQDEIRKIPAYATERIMSMGNNDLEISFDLELLKTDFEKERRRKPICAIEALLIAHKAGLYPPMWALNYISEAFRKWYEKKGSVSLDRFFGVDTYKGETPIFKTDMLEKRNESVCLTVFVLKTLFGFSIEDASYLTARRLKGSPNWFAVKSITEDTIADIYKKKYSKIYNKAKSLKGIQWSQKKKLDFLLSFPKDAFPVKKGKTLNDLKGKLKA
ncbi:MAG: hypothetical protein HZA00_10520 [Nitrospinae bacterium]|nr:hypothetical protein [Nitrospinota bacterium]